MPGEEYACLGWTASLVFLFFLFLALHPFMQPPIVPIQYRRRCKCPAAGEQVEEAGSIPAASASRPSDEYGNVTEEEVGGGEESRIADPINPGTGRCTT